VATNTLARGANGKFRLGMITPGEMVAIKELRLPMPGQAGASVKKNGCSHPLSIEREVRRLQEIRSPIAPIRKVRFSGSAGYKQMLLMPLMLGDAWQATQSIKALEDSQQPPARRRLARGVLLHVAEALESLHASGFVHGDLKPWNVLAAEDGRMVLSDLGAAKSVGLCARSMCTYNFRPPEDVDGVRPLRLLPSFDIYSLGLTYLAVLMPEQHNALTLPRKARIVPHADVAKNDPKVAEFVLEKMLHNDPSQRPSAKDVVDFVSKLPGYDTLAEKCAGLLELSMREVMGKRDKIRGALDRALEDLFAQQVATPSPDSVAPRVLSR
jgi:serine/threonine protein kinase